MSNTDIGIRAAALIQLGSKYASVIIQFAIIAVLARLITPEEFGTLAIVTVFSAFFAMFSDMGLGVAIIQFRDLDERDFGALFFFSLVLGLSLAVVFCLASYPVSIVYGDSQLVPLCCIASISLFFSTVNMVPNGLMLRDKKFTSIGMRLIVTTVVSGVVAIALAFVGWGCYALVFQLVFSAFAVFMWNIVRRPIRSINTDFVPILKKVFSYSAYQFGFASINYFSRNLDNLLIGKAIGAAALGYYDKAYKLTTYPLSMFSSVIGSVIQPYMAEHQDNPEVIFEYWKRIEKLLSIIGTAVAIVFLSCASEIIYIVYGDQWTQAIPLFQALSISVYFQMLGNPSGAFYQSLGRTDLLFKNGLINSCITVVFLLIGLATGELEIVAWLVGIAFCLHLVVTMYLQVRKAFNQSLVAMKMFLPDICIAVVSGLLIIIISPYLPQNIVISFVVKLILCCFFFLGGIVITGQFSIMCDLVFRRRKKHD